VIWNSFGLDFRLTIYRFGNKILPNQQTQMPDIDVQRKRNRIATFWRQENQIPVANADIAKSETFRLSFRKYFIVLRHRVLC
jgi:hypothetical protein